MRKILLTILAIFVIGLGFGYLAQWYGMPRIGLHAMTFGQYLVFYAIVMTAAMLIGLVKGIAGLSDRSDR